MSGRDEDGAADAGPEPHAWPIAHDFLGLTSGEARTLAAARGCPLRNATTARFCFSDLRSGRVNIWIDEHGLVARAEYY